MNFYKQIFCKSLYYSGLAHGLRVFLREPCCTILGYHRVCPGEEQDCFFPRMFAEPKAFESQMRYLKDACNVISLEEFMGLFHDGKSFKKNSVVITFDDGYEDNYRFAFPILKSLGLPATIFVPTAYVETNLSFWWDRLSFMLRHTEKQRVSIKHKDRQIDLDLATFKQKLISFNRLANLMKDFDNQEETRFFQTLQDLVGVESKAKFSPMVSWSQLREMIKGGISVGAHTHSHHAIARINKESSVEELYSSRKMLEEKLGQRIESIAYPYGEEKHINDNAIAMIKEAGYKLGLTTKQGFVYPGDDIFHLNRVGIGGNESIEVFKLKLLGMSTLIKS